MRQMPPGDPDGSDDLDGRSGLRSIQKDVIDFLADPASHGGADRVDRIETHGNLIFLAGEDAWKIKRAVRLAYMDFSSLEKRRVACVREVEINRGFGSELYLGCVPIARLPDGNLAFGANAEIVEWAVHMRRFDQSALLSHIARKQAIGDDLAWELADVVYAAHQGAERCCPSSGVEPMRRLANAVTSALQEDLGASDAGSLAHQLAHQVDKSVAILDERAARGFVRRCHGDLHLANIVMWQGRPALYDAIEFDEAIAKVDTLYDLGFLLMDLDRHRQRHAANVVLNRYLWRSQEKLDYKGLVALPLFLALRAGVRAMVILDRARQQPRRQRAGPLEDARRYSSAARAYLKAPAPRLVAIGGLSGSGKTVLATELAPALGRAPGALHLRSDLERKALAGVGEHERLPASAYTAQARTRVYEALHEKAQLVLAAGHSVIIDAVFAEPEWRQRAERLAREAQVPFCGIWLKARPEQLIARVAQRRNDASDASPETVREQLRSQSQAIAPAWAVVDAGGAPNQTLAAAQAVLGTNLTTNLETLLDDDPQP
jgi:aminoglycoside phosphotransferase family enzyme/predicted kinase